MKKKPSDIQDYKLDQSFHRVHKDGQVFSMHEVGLFYGWHTDYHLKQFGL